MTCVINLEMVPMQFKAVPGTPSYEHVATQIEEQIRRGTVAHGQKLPTEREMCAAFGVSHRVVREAIKVLHGRGLVESRQGSGIYVRNDPIPVISRALTLSVTPEERSVTDLFEFRAGLEAEAAYYAALRRTDAHLATLHEAAEASLIAARGRTGAFGAADEHLHATIHAAADNPYLLVAISVVRQMLRDVKRLIGRVGGSVTAAEQHRALVAAIAAQEPEEAARLMRAHIHYSAGRLKSVRETATSAE
jgi:GntR family transcriptional regulator, transcriptional repressor for pyruvate dehydrogenase complex